MQPLLPYFIVILRPWKKNFLLFEGMGALYFFGDKEQHTAK